MCSYGSECEFGKQKKIMQKLKELISSGDDDGGESLLLYNEDSDAYFSLSPTQRLYAFAACLLVGLLCMFLSIVVILKPIKFAVLFTFGNLMAVGSTVFLIGPLQQLSMMFDSARNYATAIYFGFVVIALISALLIHSKILTIIAVICEVCALIWYCLSYIPFARTMVSNLMIRLFDTEL
ncbi:uncharacterized protein LOC126671410 [Mercurialis annua]|uniref:uncharacterized protein LOC126671410 n=1 Tax=Mercurialis annua TaxID=3986 RepID=UPI00216094BA|nr:uncharacterized protein LOC126671410 [Mercurialis annua]